MRLDLGTLARLRTAGALDLNDLARTDGGLAAFFGDVAGVLRAVWVAGGSAGDYAGWLAGLTGADVLRHRADLAAAVAEFLPERDGDEKPPPDREHERRGLWVERLGWELAGLCGVDGSRLSLRELAWMARERRRFAGELAAWHVSYILARMPMGAVSLSPQAINPYRVEPPVTPEVAARRAALAAWHAEAALRARLGLKVEPLSREEWTRRSSPTAPAGSG